MNHPTRIGFFALLIAGVPWAGPALADGHRYTATDPTWKAECGSCHVAYPPALLPAASWRALMSGLDKHFGTDASLDPASAARITTFLEQNASRKRKLVSASGLRITETRWFRHEHDEVAGAVWKNPTVKSPSNCTACHAGAEHGDFSEDNLQIPK
jgi:hypothetical protein